MGQVGRVGADAPPFSSYQNTGTYPARPFQFHFGTFTMHGMLLLWWLAVAIESSKEGGSKGRQADRDTVVANMHNTVPHNRIHDAVLIYTYSCAIAGPISV